MSELLKYKAFILARESRGMTQTVLSKATGIPQFKISRIEQDTLKPDAAELSSIATALKYPERFFYQDVEIYPPNLHYRKRVAIPAYVKHMAEATMNIYRQNLQVALKSVELPESNVPFLDRQKTSPIEVATYLRQYWKIPKGRIENLTKILEDKGIVIIPCNFFTDKIDGRSMVTDSGTFIIFINTNLSGDRQRFTLAHELAHLILHLYSVPTQEVDTEQEANLFADEFLMPGDEIKEHLKGKKLTIPILADLKRYWKVSMQAILYWSIVLGHTKENQAKYLWSQFSSMGIRLKEPIVISPEQPTLLKELIDMMIEKLHYTKEDLANLFCLMPDELEQKYFSKQTTFKIIR